MARPDPYCRPGDSQKVQTILTNLRRLAIKGRNVLPAGLQGENLMKTPKSQQTGLGRRFPSQHVFGARPAFPARRKHVFRGGVASVSLIAAVLFLGFWKLAHTLNDVCRFLQARFFCCCFLFERGIQGLSFRCSAGFQTSACQSEEEHLRGFVKVEFNKAVCFLGAGWLFSFAVTAET